MCSVLQNHEIEIHPICGFVIEVFFLLGHVIEEHGDCRLTEMQVFEITYAHSETPHVVEGDVS